MEFQLHVYCHKPLNKPLNFPVQLSPLKTDKQWVRVNERIHVTCLVLRRDPTKRWHYYFFPLNGLGPLSAGFVIFCCLKVSGERWTGRAPQGSEDGAELGEPPAHSGPRAPDEALGLMLCTLRTLSSCRCLSPAPHPQVSSCPGGPYPRPAPT